MTDIVHQLISEEFVVGKRLGRHIEHDPRSREHPFLTTDAPLVPLHTALHKRHGSVFDQGQLGSCTGNASTGAINTEPLYHADYKKLLHEKDALAVYELATQLDSYAGSYPPDDTGSSGLAASKACLQKGYIKSYKHAFGIDQALQSLMYYPVITGVNWYEGFDSPDSNGFVHIGGQVRGGHEFCIIGYTPNNGDPEQAIVEAVNSWGKSWGKQGHFFFTVASWRQLLSEQGDVTVLIP